MKTTQNFIEEANIVHNFKYNYSFVDYRGCKSKIIVVCPTHGKFTQSPTNHLSGFGCILCGIDLRSKSKIDKCKISFFDKSNLIHNYKYDYSLVEYISATDNVNIICPLHGVFEQTPNNHLSGKGCSRCFIDNNKILQKMDQIDFVKKCNYIHNHKYDYSLLIYNGMTDKIKIICKKHGEFYQLASNHISGKGCSKCRGNVSTLETQWLNSLNIKNEFRNYSLKINKFLFKVDGYDPVTNTIYEFYGDYWHGNPIKFNINNTNNSTKKTFGELYKNTIERENLLKKVGYKIISIWESDWNIK